MTSKTDDGASHPDVWPASLAETHTAVLFFVGDRAYKIKKPVRFPFLDFSTAELRGQACDREVLLNRRIAPDVYIGVATVSEPDRPGTPGSTWSSCGACPRTAASRRW